MTVAMTVTTSMIMITDIYAQHVAYKYYAKQRKTNKILTKRRLCCLLLTLILLHIV